MKEKIRIFIYKFYNYCKLKSLNLLKNIITSYKRCRLGEENLNTVRYFWCLVPSILYIFFMYKKFFGFGIINKIFNVLFFTYFLLTFYFIKKLEQVHPELFPNKTEELKIDSNEKLASKLSKKCGNFFMETFGFGKKKYNENNIQSNKNKTIKILVVLNIILTLKYILF